MVSFIEVLGGEHLQCVVSCEHRADAVRSGRGFAVLSAFDEVHLGGLSLQRVRTVDVQKETRGVAYDDQALGLSCDVSQLGEQNVCKRAEWMLGPAFLHLDRISLERSQQIERIETDV